MVIGGIAVIVRGVRRFTGDIDAAVRGDEIEVDELLAVLRNQKIVPRIPNADQFARESLVLLLVHEPSKVELDVSFAWTAFEREAIAAATVESFAGVGAPVARPEDLVVFKAIAGRPTDRQDMLALLVRYPRLDLKRVRRRVAELAALIEAEEPLRALDETIAAARKTRATPRAAPRSGRASPRASPGTARSPRRPRR